MDTESILKFKKVLEYFVAHLSYMQSGKSQDIPGYAQYIKPYEDKGNFAQTGQGYNGGTIQNQIKDWEMIDGEKLCVNVQPNFGSYQSRKCYLNWIRTGINIFAQWSDDQINGVSIGFSYWWKKPIGYKVVKAESFDKLGLYDNSDQPNSELIKFYDYFMNEIKEFHRGTSEYYKAVSEYYRDTESKTKLLENNDIINTILANRNVIFTGAPGTGKTYWTKELAAQIILNDVYDERDPAQKSIMDEQYDFVQFHPSYDYTDFVEGLRPIDDGNGNISFRREDGIFMAFCRKALKAFNEVEDKQDAPKYVFVIDEINRGELSKILGELFFSIDPGYRGVKGKVKTQYHNLWKNSVDETQKRFGDTDFFYIPENVYIIGTMNDIDRSVESMDFAMRRRFAFKEVSVSDRLDMIRKDKILGKSPDEILRRLENLNLCILSIQGLSSAYQIGAAYFLKLKNYLKDDNSIAPESWESLWKNHIYGLLFEYLRGFPDAQESLHLLYEAFQLKSTYSQTGGKIIKVDNNG